MKELFKVLKDHSNRFMQELVFSSFQHCFLSEVESILEDPDRSMDIQECGTENVVRVRLVHAPFRSVLSEATAKIQHANLIIDRFGLNCNQEANSAKEKEEELRLGDKTTVLINDIAIAMKRLNYSLHRGAIHKRWVVCAKVPFTRFPLNVMSRFSSTASLAANESFKSRLLKDMKRVIDLLADPDCEVIGPIVIDYNLIEVNSGYS